MTDDALRPRPAANAATLTGKQFFPTVISGPFHHGLIIVFTAAAIMSFIGAMVSLMRGKQFYYTEPGSAPAAVSTAAAAANGHGANGNGAAANGGAANGAAAGAGDATGGNDAPGANTADGDAGARPSPRGHG